MSDDKYYKKIVIDYLGEPIKGKALSDSECEERTDFNRREKMRQDSIVQVLDIISQGAREEAAKDNSKETFFHEFNYGVLSAITELVCMATQMTGDLRDEEKENEIVKQ